MQSQPLHDSSHYHSVIIVTGDTDVLILYMAVQARVGCNLYVKCGPRVRTSILNIKKMYAAVGQGTCTALLGMHAFTGCDTVSAFSGQGKLKALKLLLLNTTCQ